MGDNVTKYGRVRYIDPNAILQDKMFNNGDKKHPQYNIPFNMEDYCIAVDLIVEVPERRGDAETKSKQHKITLGSAKGRDMSILGGTDGFLTSNPGSTTYLDVLTNNLEGVQENFGITNIHISYTSYFYPQVTINFTDIRGAALMMPHEENYRRKKANEEAIKANREKVYDTSVENFFACMFSFPYPEFKLQVKGFYGKMVEYSLIVEDFRSEFNAQTGNFDATVKFIGRMFGVYTDIPMSYLLVAPYCKYGGSDETTIWQKHVSQGHFKFDNGVDMPTLVELKEMLANANTRLERDMNYTKTQRYQKLLRQQEAIQNVKDGYLGVLGSIKSKQGKNENVMVGTAFKRDYHLFFETTDSTKPVEYLYENSSELLQYTQKMHDLISRYNESKYDDTQLPFLGNLTARQDVLMRTSREKDSIKCYKTKLLPGANARHTIQEGGETYEIKYSLNGEELSNEIFEQIQIGVGKWFKGKISDQFYYFLPFDCRKFSETIIKIEKEITQEIRELREEISDDYGRRMEEVLGFLPSMRNIFRVIMAHLQTFVEIYMTFLNNISGTNSRKMSDYGLSFNNSDIPQRGDKVEDTSIPPFPAIIDNYSNEYCYPNGILSKTLEEENLIDCMFDGAFLTLKKETEANESINDLKDDSIDFFPTCISDLSILTNPYDKVFDVMSSSDNHIAWIMAYFGIRCMTKYLVEKSGQIDVADFGKVEALNFWSANQNLSESTIEMLKATSFNIDNFISFLYNNTDNNPYIIDKKPCYGLNAANIALLKTNSGGNGSCTWSNFNLPAAIGRDGGDFKTYINDTKNVNNSRQAKYSLGKTSRADVKFKNENYSVAHYYTYIPYHYIQLQDKAVFQEWSDKINAFDMSKCISDDKKKLLIEQYLTPTKDIFSSWTVRYRTKPEEADYFLKFEESDPNEDHPDLKEYYNNNFEGEYYLDSIRNWENTPTFFEPNLSPAIFLCQIPFDYEKIGDLLCKGRTCFTMPYVLELFIGLCIKRIKGNDTGKDIEGIITRLSGEIYGKGEQTDNNKARVRRFLQKIITHFLIFPDGNMYAGTDNAGWITQDFSTWKDGLDYLGLEAKYNEWAESTQPGGWKYLLNMYLLKPKKNFDLTKFLKNLKNPSTPGDPNNNASMKKSFDDLYTVVNGTATSNDFSRRYSNVRFTVDSNSLKLGFNKDFEAYPYLCDLFTKHSILIFPYKTSELDSYTTNDVFINAFTAFKTKLIELYDGAKVDPATGEQKVDYSKMSSSNVNEDAKLSMYLTFKNINDKHLGVLNTSNEHLFDINDKDKRSEYQRFHFIDTYYNDIGDILIVNAEKLDELINQVMNKTENGSGEGIVGSEMSLYSFLAKICEDSNTMFMALPVFNGNMTGEDGASNFEDMFTPIPYDKIQGSGIFHGPTYVCFYPHQPSKHLDIPDSQYKNDGFLIANDIDDVAATADFAGATSIADWAEETKDTYTVPAFSVEYGQQNQNIFTNVNVNMDNPMVTEHSIAAQFNIANGKQTEVRKTSFEGQNLFDVYTNHSYTCNVEMMGCSQIMPLMYFQLNNIPMFRGAYMIINVEHNITPGNMVTSFKGVRVNKNKIPMVKNLINLNSILDNASGQSAYNAAKNKKTAPPFTGNLIVGTSGGDGMDGIPSDANYNLEKFTTDFGVYFRMESVSSHPGGKKGAFNGGNSSLRSMVYAITKKMKENGYGVEVNSMTRSTSKWAPKSSDHSVKVGDKFLGSTRRTKLQGLDGDGNMKPYSEMGCATDLDAYKVTNGKAGSTDKTNANIALFSLIATTFTNNIRQLIWEVANGHSTTEDRISQCVHVSSYGPRGENGTDKTEIFVAVENASGWGAVIADNKKDLKKAPTNLPPMFIKTLYEMSKIGKLTNEVTINNFAKIGVKTSQLTTELLKSWCEQLNVSVT